MNLLNRAKVMVAAPILGNHIKTTVEAELASITSHLQDISMSKAHTATKGESSMLKAALISGSMGRPTRW